MWAVIVLIWAVIVLVWAVTVLVWAVTVLVRGVTFLLWAVIAAMWAVIVPLWAVIDVWALKGVFDPVCEKTLKIASFRSVNLSSNRQNNKIIKLPHFNRKIF